MAAKRTQKAKGDGSLVHMKIPSPPLPPSWGRSIVPFTSKGLLYIRL